MAVIVPFDKPAASIERLNALVAPDMERVNTTILSRTGSDVTMIPEVANHLISSGGKRLRPMLTLAMAQLAGYSGEGHIKFAAAPGNDSLVLKPQLQTAERDFKPGRSFIISNE